MYTAARGCAAYCHQYLLTILDLPGHQQPLVSQLLDVVGIAGRRYRLGGAPAALTPRARSGSLLCQSARDADRPCADRTTGTGIEDHLDVLIGGFRPSLRSTTLGVSVSPKPHDRIDLSRRRT